MDMTARTDLLFKTITRPDGKQYSYRQIEERADGEISSTAIWKLRVGKTENPSQRMLKALSEAFQVDVGYFFDEDVTREDIPEYREQYLSDRLIEEIALRAHGLTNEGKQAVLEVIDYVRKEYAKGRPGTP